MQALAKDTSAQTETILIDLWRQRTPAQKLRGLAGLRRTAKLLILGRLHKEFPGADESELHYQLFTRRYGKELADKISLKGKFQPESAEEKIVEEPGIITLVTGRLDKLKIPYFISGSIASIVYGEERLTKDVDMVIRLFPFQIQPFIELFEADFVVSADAIRDAVNRGFTFNIIHINTAFKIDLFPVSDKDKLEADMFARRQRENIGAEEVWLASAEDIILAKLRWFRKGGEVSDPQWRDVLGVLKVQGEKLDFDYLEAQAQRFGFADLLIKARGLL